MRRREFISLLGGTALACPLAARAQQSTMPVIGFIRDGSAQGEARWVGGFHKGLSETGYVEGKNVTVEYHWLEGKYDRLPELFADLVRRQVAVIATLSTFPTEAAKAATATIPIVFGIGTDPIELGLVRSFAKPGGNVTGVSVSTAEVVAKRLRLLHDLLPNAVRIAVLVDPNNATITKTTVQDVQKAAPIIGLQTHIINATTVGEINEVFAAFERERPDALFVVPDPFLTSRRVQLATLTAHERIPATYPLRDYVEVGGLMSYGPDFTDMFRQVGVYTGSILKGAKPAELPVLQSNKFDLVINITTANALGLTIPAGVMSIADEVIE
jgi:putative tryptophan/tyrosine transport system substrate-binding protein